MTKRWGSIHPRPSRCRGTYLLVKDGKVVKKIAEKLSLSGRYVVGVSSIASISGIEDKLFLHVSIRSSKGTVWESEQCMIGKNACPLSNYANSVTLIPGEYELDAELLEAPKDLNGGLCVAPAAVDGSLLVTGATPGDRTVMTPARGSTRSWSLMVGKPVSVDGVCVQRLWLWFFEPRGVRRHLLIRLERGGELVDSVSTELFRVGIYSEIVVDVLNQHKGGSVVFLDPASLTRPLFTTHTEVCGDAD